MYVQSAMKKLAKSGGKKKEKKEWAQPAAPGTEKPKREKKAEVFIETLSLCYNICK